jgi:hypothetical protein
MDEQASTSKVTSTSTVTTTAAAIPSSEKQQKPPSTLFLGPSPFYRNVSGRLSLNDRHLQHNRSRTAGTSAATSDCNTWSQAATWRPGNASSNNGPVQAIPRRVASSNPTTPSSPAPPFPFYTKPEPIVLGTSSQYRTSPSGIGVASRRPHSVAATPTTPAATSLAPYFPWSSADSGGLQTGPRRPHSIASSPVSSKAPGPIARPRDGPVALSSYGILHQPIPRRPHSIATSSAITPPTPSAPITRTGGSPQQQVPRRPFIPNSTSVPILLPSSTSSPTAKPSSSMQQPAPRRPHSMVVTASSSATLPHATTNASSCVSVITTGSSHTWSSSSGQHRRVATTSATPTCIAITLSPSDSGYRSLPPATSDYQSLNSSQVTHSSGTRRLSLPSTSAQVALGLQAPRPSPTFHGLPFLPVRPLTCGLSPNGNPIFLGCTHLHTPNSKSNNTPATTPSKTVASTTQALQQLLLQQPRNGFRSLDDKVKLFLEILDTQERFEQVRHLSSCSSWIVVTLRRSLLSTVSIICCVACSAE